MQVPPHPCRCRHYREPRGTKDFRTESPDVHNRVLSGLDDPVSGVYVIAESVFREIHAARSTQLFSTAERNLILDRFLAAAVSSSPENDIVSHSLPWGFFPSEDDSAPTLLR